MENEINYSQYFPYDPYPNQIEFTKKLFEVLNLKKAGIFESPTGTGKSLSLLCGILNFLTSQKSITNQNSEDDWLNNFGKNSAKKRKYSEMVNDKKYNINSLKFKNSSEEDDMLIDIQEYNLTYTQSDTEKDDNKIQILYCTRTHSQITQIVSEIKKIKSKKNLFEFSFVSIGSRKLLCINKKVNKQTSSINQINENCIDLIKNEKNCEFYNQNSIELFSKEILTNTYDIEELHKLGNEIKCCPYYSTKKSFDSADIIILPYNTVINSKIRRSMNINLNNKIIVFDEAHNIVENILQTYNAEINLDSFILNFIGISLYYEKYGNRLKSVSNMYLRQIINCLDNMINFLLMLKDSKIYNLSEFNIDLNFTNINFFKLISFIDISDLGYKVKYVFDKKFSNKITYEESMLFDLLSKFISKFDNLKQKFNEKNINKLKLGYSNEEIKKLSDFFNCLTYISEDGKIIIDKYQSIYTIHESYSIKFIMINPTREFDYIIKNSRNLIFAGGTMKPLDEFDNLLKSIDKNLIVKFEGSHVINKDNVLVRCICSDIKNSKSLYFNYENMKNNQEFLINSIIDILTYHKEIFENNFNNSGKGIVLFVHNYELLDKLKQVQVLKNKNIFFEEKQSLQDTFGLYQTSIKNNNISILFAVIGGKLSEGINFIDDLARCIIVFGLPYPNIKSIDVKLKMEYYDYLYKNKESSINGDEYYDNICMKSVNQTIGRAIRHKNDYACIILVDSRYNKDRIKAKLPNWILNSGIKSILSKSELDVYKNQLIKFLKQ